MGDRNWQAMFSPMGNFIIVQDVGGWGLLTDMWVFSVPSKSNVAQSSIFHSTTYSHPDVCVFVKEKSMATECADTLLKNLRENSQ